MKKKTLKEVWLADLDKLRKYLIVQVYPGPDGPAVSPESYVHVLDALLRMFDLEQEVRALPDAF